MSSSVKTLVVEQSLPVQRLDAYLKAQFPEVSRGAIQRLLADQHILVDGKSVKPTHQPRLGEVISIDWPEARPAEALPEKIPLEILFEDRDLLVINKPAGLVIHPAPGHEEHTLVNALLHHCAGQLSGIGGVARPGIVHRLDKDTSGCLIVAKNDATHSALAAQFAGREVEKYYRAIVCGVVPRARGDIREPIARHSIQRKRMAVAKSGGREAHTGYRVLERLNSATLLELQLYTGRTHQIRVHLQHLGFPVVGDELYGKRQNARLQEATGCAAPRQMLHAAKLVLTHPATGQRLTFEASCHDDFSVTLRQLRVK